MVRDYRAAARSTRTVPVPRWMVIGVCLFFILFFVYTFLRAPTWIVQRLDSPDGKIQAVLHRTRHIGEHYEIKVRNNLMWNRLYTSPRLDRNFSVDRHERLAWNEDSTRLFFTIDGQRVWGYDFSTDRPVNRADLQSFTASPDR